MDGIGVKKRVCVHLRQVHSGYKLSRATKWASWPPPGSCPDARTTTLMHMTSKE